MSGFDFADGMAQVVDMYGNRHLIDPSHVVHLSQHKGGGCVLHTSSDFNLRLPSPMAEVVAELDRARKARLGGVKP